MTTSRESINVYTTLWVPPQVPRGIEEHSRTVMAHMESFPTKSLARPETNRPEDSQPRKRKRRQLHEIGLQTILTESRTPTPSNTDTQNLPTTNPTVDSIEVNPIEIDRANKPQGFSNGTSFQQPQISSENLHDNWSWR